jgi:hypothetical protein
VRGHHRPGPSGGGAALRGGGQRQVLYCVRQMCLVRYARVCMHRGRCCTTSALRNKFIVIRSVTLDCHVSALMLFLRSSG